MGLLMNRAKIFNGILMHEYFGVKRPLTAYLLLTNRCNLKCRYCFVDVNTIYKTDFTIDEWKQTITDLKARGCVSITLMGGEPLLFRDLPELVNHAKKLGLNIEMTTNGVNVEKQIESVKKMNAVMLSLDGPREANDNNRGKGSFDKAMNALKVMKEHKVPFRINSVVTRQNYTKEAMEFLLDLADEYGTFVTFSLTAEFPHDAKALEDEIMLNREEVREYYRRVMEYKNRGRRILFSKESIDYVIDYPLPYQEIVWRGDEKMTPKKTCLFGQTFVYVNSNGDIIPCATLWNKPESFTPKNIRRDGIDAALLHASDLKCKSCFCPGVPEWKRVATVKGAVDGVKVTLGQVFG